MAKSDIEKQIRNILSIAEEQFPHDDYHNTLAIWVNSDNDLCVTLRNDDGEPLSNFKKEVLDVSGKTLPSILDQLLGFVSAESQRYIIKDGKKFELVLVEEPKTQDELIRCDDCRSYLSDCTCCEECGQVEGNCECCEDCEMLDCECDY